MGQQRIRTPQVLCQLKAWQWQVEGSVVAGIVHKSRVAEYKDGTPAEFVFDYITHYPAGFDEGPFMLGRLHHGDYIKLSLEEKGCGDPLKSLFGGKSPDKSG